MSMTYAVLPVNGTQEIQTNQKGDRYHDLAIGVKGAAMSGSLVLKGRKPGATVFESIPDGTFDLSSLHTIQFIGAVAEYQVEITGISGVVSMTITDTHERAHL